MKSADIKIGEQYKVGYYGCGEVMETRVERVGWRGGKGRKDGVRVKFLSGYREGDEMTVSSREVDMLWSEHEAAKQDAELKRKIAEQDRERMSDKVEQAKQAFEAIGINVKASSAAYDWQSRQQGEIYDADFTFTEAELDKVLALIQTPEAGARAKQAVNSATSNPLAELLA